MLIWVGALSREVALIMKVALVREGVLLQIKSERDKVF